jgi:predicted DsbA family dithiol-disulfide isomerase
MSRTPNTFNAHRLIWLAGKKGGQDAAVEALFRAYFTEGRDVGDTVLIDLATKAGLDRARAAALFESADGIDEVRLHTHGATTSGISGVPTFVLDGKPLFSGALKPELMAARLREAAASHAKL